MKLQELTEAKHINQKIPLKIVWASRYNGVHVNVDHDKSEFELTDEMIDDFYDIFETLPEITSEMSDDLNDSIYGSDQKELMRIATEMVQKKYPDMEVVSFEEDDVSS